MRPRQKKKNTQETQQIYKLHPTLTKNLRCTQNNVHIRKVDNSCLLWGRADNYQFIICMPGKSAKV